MTGLLQQARFYGSDISNFSLAYCFKLPHTLSSRAKSRDLRTDFTCNTDEMRRFLDSLTLARNDMLG